MLLRPPKGQGTTVKFLPRWKGPYPSCGEDITTELQGQRAGDGQIRSSTRSTLAIYGPWSQETLKNLVQKAKDVRPSKKRKVAIEKSKGEIESDDDSSSDEDDDQDMDTLTSGDATETMLLNQMIS